MFDSYDILKQAIEKASNDLYSESSCIRFPALAGTTRASGIEVLIQGGIPFFSHYTPEGSSDISTAEAIELLQANL